MEPLVLREEPVIPHPPEDLGERTARFGEAIIRFAKKIPRNPVNNRLIDQLVGAGTSVGANYCEADDAVSGKEFKQKIGTCRKESKESMFFLRMVATAEEGLATEARVLWREAKELNLIFGAIWRK
jgi:four helix bundle protein